MRMSSQFSRGDAIHHPREVPLLHHFHPCLQRLGHVIVPAKMQESVDRQPGDFLTNRDAVFPGLTPRGVHADVDLPLHVAISFERKRDDIGDGIMPEELPVESVYDAIVDEDIGDRRGSQFFDAKDLACGGEKQRTPDRACRRVKMHMNRKHYSPG